LPGRLILNCLLKGILSVVAINLLDNYRAQTHTLTPQKAIVRFNPSQPRATGIQALNNDRATPSYDFDDILPVWSIGAGTV
jgi:hypothetical protein